MLAFLIIIFCLIISSLFTQELAQRLFYQAVWFKILWAVIAIGLSAAAINFLKRRLFAFAVICLGLLFILFGGLLTSFLGEEGFIEIKEGQAVNGFYKEDDLFRRLDFSFTLEDFSVEYYSPRQQDTEHIRLAKSYKSKVRIHRNGSLLAQGDIEVNKPLSYRGFSFYQYGYDEAAPDKTLLQVVKDPGAGVAYSGYFFLLTGLILGFKKIFFSV